MVRIRSKISAATIEQDNSVRLLLTVLGFIVLFIGLSLVTLLFNGRSEDQTGSYNADTRTLFLQNAPGYTGQKNYSIERYFTFIPGVGLDDVAGGDFLFADITTYERVENISFSYPSGWNNLGSEAVRYEGSSFTANEPGMEYGAYTLRLMFEPGTTFYLSIPDINGTAHVFCNGKYIGRLGDVRYSDAPSVKPGFLSVPIHSDDDGIAEIVIAVEVPGGLTNPGILSMPFFCGNNEVIIHTAISSVWLSALTTLILLTWIGIAVIGSSFKKQRRFFLLIIFEAFLFTYILIDLRYLVVFTLSRIMLRYVIRLIMAGLFYSFIVSVYDNARVNKYGKYTDILVIWAFILAMSLTVVADPSNATSPVFGIASIFFVLMSVLLAFLRIVLFHLHEKNATFTLIAGIACFFSFLYMHMFETLKYNIPSYTIVIAFSGLFLEFYFLSQYVRQYMALDDLTVNLTRTVNEKTEHITRINSDLLEKNRQLLENEEARKNVLSNVSHDLRTPITAIRGYAELLLSGGERMSAEQKIGYLQNIIKRCQQMERIVSDIVELTRMESNTNEFQFVEMSLAELLDELYMMYEGDLRGTAKKMTIDLPETDLLMVRADPKKLSRVFENLISNAINYTYDEALIRIKAYREGGKIHIIIADNGIGIPQEEQSKIFDRFYRAKNSGKNIKGTGLGLSIVKLIIDHHNAEISVESALGAGTAFHIIMDQA